MQHYEEIFYPIEPAYLLQRLGARMSYELPLYKVANSSWLKRQMADRFHQDVPFSTNAIVVSDFSPKRKASARDGIIRIVTYVHPLAWKGFPDAVCAIRAIRERYGAKVEWHVFGYRHHLLEGARRECAVTYHPDLSFAQLADLYATSDIALCPSWYESFPLPPLEAMACGTAVITTDAGTEDYAFHEKNALIIPARKLDQMIAALARLIEDEQLRVKLAREGRKTAEAFTWEKAVEERERILLAIHHGEVEYDRWGPTKLGLNDGSGIPFESAPPDLSFSRSQLFRHYGSLFLIHHNVKHQVQNESLIPQGAASYSEEPPLGDSDLARIPLGPPITKLADLPPDLIRNAHREE